MFMLSPIQQRPVLSRQPFSWFRLTPFFTEVRVPAYEGVRGMVNRRGLTGLGREYLSELMRHGMLIGLEHMSQQSVTDAHRVVGDKYPMAVSHAHFRRLSLQNRENAVEAYLPSEYEISDSDVDRVRRSSGFLGQFVAEQPVEYPDSLLHLSVVSGRPYTASTQFLAELLHVLRRSNPANSMGIALRARGGARAFEFSRIGV